MYKQKTKNADNSLTDKMTNKLTIPMRQLGWIWGGGEPPNNRMGMRLFFNFIRLIVYHLIVYFPFCAHIFIHIFVHPSPNRLKVCPVGPKTVVGRIGFKT